MYIFIQILYLSLLCLLSSDLMIKYRICFFIDSEVMLILYIYNLKMLFIYFFRERGREGEREGEKHQRVVAPHMPPTGDLAHNPGMLPNWELNQ